MTDKKFSILITEDNESDFVLAKYHLAKHFNNATFRRAEGVETFKDRILEEKPDIIICDFQLRDGTGLEALTHIVKNDLDIPFVFFTGALNNEQKAADAIFKGADGYILKDNLDLLPETVANILQRRINEEEVKKKRQAKIDKALVYVELATTDSLQNDLDDQLKKLQDILKELKQF